MAKSRDLELGRLCMAMHRARLVLKRVREERREAVREYVGSHWSEQGSPEPVPVNLLALYVSIISRNLIAKNPRVMLSTFHREHKPVVSAMEAWANKAIEQMHLADTLQRVVVDGLFSVGICKVAIASPSDTASVGWNLAPGSPFAQRVDLDDFVFDIHARDFSECGYIGHRFRAPLEVVRKQYANRKIERTDDQLFNLEGDERIHVLGRGFYGDQEEYEDFVDLWEIYLPRHRVVVTLLNDYLTGAEGGEDYRKMGAKALKEQKWLGPDEGPYHILGYGVVPGNTMPKAPVQDLIDMHQAVNNIVRKLIRQAERQKENVFVHGGADADGRRVMDANDGEIIRVDNPERLKTAVYGGPNQQNNTLFLEFKDIFSWLGGNLDIMGGLSPQSKTATQDKMLNENSSRTVADMQDRTVGFTADVLKALCWYWHHHPTKVMKVAHAVPGLPQMSITRQVHPQQRQQVPFDDLEVAVDPYSLQHQTPQMRMAALNQVVTQIITPMMSLLQQQGIQFDMNVFLQKIAKYMDMPDLAEIITMRDPPAQQAPSEGEQPKMPNSTNRSYTRENVPGRTEKGNTMNLVNSLMGVDGGGDPNKNGSVNGVQ